MGSSKYGIYAYYVDLTKTPHDHEHLVSGAEDINPTSVRILHVVALSCVKLSRIKNPWLLYRIDLCLSRQAHLPSG